ncbi:hypothetical protein CSA56_10985 [candidate division KSB3 bacterium]|uniref:Uncharacterized protein n=1 Tax=candidate division KSB3 bacterium TaxID=2044937 RepID=A0A2G6KFA3_9BACT|nr:MAG: hypothetical protein CSA56_10985 [candidate division KSB3 bacterium]
MIRTGLECIWSPKEALDWLLPETPQKWGQMWLVEFQEDKTKFSIYKLYRNFVHFGYVFVKLLDFNAQDYYTRRNDVIKILLPTMKYEPSERWKVIRQTDIGLFQFSICSPLRKIYELFPMATLK